MIRAVQLKEKKQKEAKLKVSLFLELQIFL
jgi:hypothetical protein